jgi:hypothetical protein
MQKVPVMLSGRRGDSHLLFLIEKNKQKQRPRSAWDGIVGVLFITMLG